MSIVERLRAWWNPHCDGCDCCFWPPRADVSPEPKVTVRLYAKNDNGELLLWEEKVDPPADGHSVVVRGKTVTTDHFLLAGDTLNLYAGTMN